MSKKPSDYIKEREREMAEEKPFAFIDLGSVSAPIKPCEIDEVAQVLGFALKYVGMSEREAFDYAILTFVLMRAGNPQEKADAQITCGSAFKWDWDNRGDFQNWLMHRMECHDIFYKYFGRKEAI